MQHRILQKIGLAALTLLITLLLVFVLIRSVPGDPAAALLGEHGSPEAIAEVTRLWGLDKPLPEQFFIYVGNLLQGNTGISFQYAPPGSQVGTSVLDLVLVRLPNTLLLALTSLVIAVVAAIPLGMLMAAKADTFVDHAITSVGLLLTSLPTFWLGMLAVTFFSMKLGWLPSGGSGSIAHAIMPATILSLSFIVLLSRVTRTEIVRVMRSDYIRVARAKGLPPNVVLWKHALRNAMIPLVTLIGLRLGALLNGAIVVEVVFRWPGLGQLMINSISARDYPTIQFLVPFTALIFITLNFITDIVYSMIDPRIGKE